MVEGVQVVQREGIHHRTWRCGRRLLLLCCLCTTKTGRSGNTGHLSFATSQVGAVVVVTGATVQGLISSTKRSVGATAAAGVVVATVATTSKRILDH